MMTSEERKLLYAFESRFIEIWAEAWNKEDSRTMFQGATPEEANCSFLKSKGPWVDFVHSIGAEFMQQNYDLTDMVFVPDPYSSREDRALSGSEAAGYRQLHWIAVPGGLAMKILALGYLP